MKLLLRVKPNAKEEKIVQTGPGEYQAWVKAAPVDGKANEAVLRVLADHFHVPKSLINIISGHNARVKRVEIAG